MFTELNIKTVPFQAVQFSISVQISSISPIDMTLSGATTPGKSGPGSDGNKGLLRFHQSSSITGISPLDCLESYPGHSGGGYYLSAEKQSIYSTVAAGWEIPSSASFTGVFKYLWSGD